MFVAFEDMAGMQLPRVILVLEPDVLVRTTVAEYLRACGYRVIEGIAATDVGAVLNQGHRLDVILADVNLAGDVNGFTLAKNIRQTHPMVDVILTAGVTGTVASCKELCDEGPIPKPYHP